MSAKIVTFVREKSSTKSCSFIPVTVVPFTRAGMVTSVCDPLYSVTIPFLSTTKSFESSVLSPSVAALWVPAGSPSGWLKLESSAADTAGAWISSRALKNNAIKRISRFQFLISQSPFWF